MLIGSGDWALRGWGVSNLPVMGSPCSRDLVFSAEKLGSVTAVPGCQLGVGWQCDLQDLFVYPALVSV